MAGLQSDRADGVRVTHHINIEDLVKLKEVFGQEGELEEDEFVQEFGQVLGDNLTEGQLTHLFMKIDANSDGSGECFVLLFLFPSLFHFVHFILSFALWLLCRNVTCSIFPFSFSPSSRLG